jgi:hypothetical protein
MVALLSHILDTNGI